MPIAFECSCGKSLQVKDEHAGRRVRCPACSETLSVPAPMPQFEVVEDDEPAPRAAPIRAKVVERSREDDDDEERPRSKRKSYDLDDDDEEEERPRKKKKKRSRVTREKPQEQSHFAMEKSIVNGGVAGGLLAMIIAVVWFVAGLMNDRIFFYPPILLVVGLIAFFKGLMGGGSED